MYCLFNKMSCVLRLSLSLSLYVCVRVCLCVSGYVCVCGLIDGWIGSCVRAACVCANKSISRGNIHEFLANSFVVSVIWHRRVKSESNGLKHL